MSVKNSVIRSSSHKKEAQSKRNFEQAIPDWSVNWSQQDYGADALVELTSKIKNSEDFRTEGKYFLVQLKATEKLKQAAHHIVFVVPVKKVITWANSNVPFLFVVNDLLTNQFYYVWMDEALTAELNGENPTWAQQVSVSIKVPKANALVDDYDEKIRSYVYSFRRSHIKPLDAGQFFFLKDKLESLIGEYESISSSFGFQSTKSSITGLKDSLNKSLYQIAIAGQSRAGKSSLVNALVQMKICPTGYFQTTGVPIQIIPDKEEYVQILFFDGRKQKLPFLFENINEYASQELNPDNQKKVALVLVSIRHKRFQKGISIYDVPGLDDPDEDISVYTWAAVNRANAVLYLVDITPAEHGGFILNNQFKRNITELSKSLEKIFLVFNKVDTLSAEKLVLVRDRVIVELKKLNLYERINSKVYYITAEVEKERPDFDSFSKLQDDVWNYIIEENKYGIVKLLFINQELQKSTQAFLEILQARLVDGRKRRELLEAIDQVKAKIPELEKVYASRVHAFKRQHHTLLDNKKHHVVFRLEEWLKSLQLSDDFPSKTEIRNFLRDSLNEIINEGNTELTFFLKGQKDFLDSWIEDNLRQLKEMLSQSAQQKIVDLEDLERFETPTVDLSSAFGMGALAYVLAAIYMPAVAVGAALFTFVGSLIFTAESRRAKRILKTVAKSRVIYNATIDKLKQQYDEIIVEYSQTYERYAADKLKYYFQDLQIQISKLSVAVSSDEEKDISQANHTISTLREKQTNLQAELLAYKI